jgi:hypothetical protein
VCDRERDREIERVIPSFVWKIRRSPKEVKPSLSNGDFYRTSMVSEMAEIP